MSRGDRDGSKPTAPGLPRWRSPTLARTPDNTSDIRFNFGSDGFSVLILDQGTTAWSGSIHVAPLDLWIAGIPLALTFLWVYVQRTIRALVSGGIVNVRW